MCESTKLLKNNINETESIQSLYENLLIKYNKLKTNNINEKNIDEINIKIINKS